MTQKSLGSHLLWMFVLPLVTVGAFALAHTRGANLVLGGGLAILAPCLLWAGLLALATWLDEGTGYVKDKYGCFGQGKAPWYKLDQNSEFIPRWPTFHFSMITAIVSVWAVLLTLTWLSPLHWALATIATLVLIVGLGYVSFPFVCAAGSGPPGKTPITLGFQGVLEFLLLPGAISLGMVLIAKGYSGWAWTCAIGCTVSWCLTGLWTAIHHKDYVMSRQT